MNASSKDAIVEVVDLDTLDEYANDKTTDKLNNWHVFSKKLMASRNKQVIVKHYYRCDNCKFGCLARKTVLEFLNNSQTIYDTFHNHPPPPKIEQIKRNQINTNQLSLKKKEQNIIITSKNDNDKESYHSSSSKDLIENKPEEIKRKTNFTTKVSIPKKSKIKLQNKKRITLKNYLPTITPLQKPLQPPPSTEVVNQKTTEKERVKRRNLRNTISFNLKETLKKAMEDNEIIEITYNNGNDSQQKLVQPLEWLRKGLMFRALCLDSDSPKKENFVTNKVISIKL